MLRPISTTPRDPLRDPRKKPLPGDRFRTPDGYFIHVVGIGTNNYRPFAEIQRVRKRRAEGEEIPIEEQQPQTTMCLYWDKLLPMLAIFDVVSDPFEEPPI